MHKPDTDRTFTIDAAGRVVTRPRNKPELRNPASGAHVTRPIRYECAVRERPRKTAEERQARIDALLWFFSFLYPISQRGRINFRPTEERIAAARKAEPERREPSCDPGAYAGARWDVRYNKRQARRVRMARHKRRGWGRS